MSFRSWATAIQLDPIKKAREPITWVGPLMLRYMAHMTGHGIYHATRWQEHLSKEERDVELLSELSEKYKAPYGPLSEEQIVRIKQSAEVGDGD